MNNKRLSTWIFSLCAIIICMAIALYMRIVLPYASIFTAEGIRFTGIDSYFYMRLVDSLVHNFPQMISFDPYMIYPGGDYISRVPTFFAFMLSGLIKLFGGANPGQQVIDSISVFVPPLLGTLSVIPIYCIGKELVNKWAGLAAALIFALTPGELLSRSLLGYTDHHMAEVFFTTYFAMFFILAIKNGRKFTYQQLMQGRFSVMSQHLIYSLIAGLFLGLYLITWQGALLFILILFIYFVIQFISDYIHDFPSDYLSKIAIISFLVALLIFVPTSNDKLTLLALASLVLVPIALNVLSSLMQSREIKPAYFIYTVCGLAVLGGLASWLLLPSVFNSVTNYLSYIFVWRIDQAIVGEMKPLFFPGGVFDNSLAWSEYGLTFYLAVAGLAVLIVTAIRQGKTEHIFTAAWGLVMLLSALAMVRFTYYFGVCAALLTGYLFGWCIKAITATRNPSVAASTQKKAKKHSPKPARLSASRVTAMALIAAAMIIMLAPGVVNAVNIARNPGHMPTEAWVEAMAWMKKNTPEPFGNSDYYYEYYSTPATDKEYEYPDTAYSVMTWSDYGYWLTRMGHRIPVANPAITHFDEARYYTAQDSASAGTIMKNLGSRFVVIDNRIVSPNDKFYALAIKSNKQESDYYELCWQISGDKYVPVLVFYPEYYRTMLSRLYNFDCKEVKPESTTVMSWEKRPLQEGTYFKVITGLKKFNSFTEAEAFLSDDDSGRRSIIGTDPLVSPVPLEALTDYKTVFQSTHKESAGSTPVPAVKIFEYTAR